MRERECGFWNQEEIHPHKKWQIYFFSSSWVCSFTLVAATTSLRLWLFSTCSCWAGLGGRGAPDPSWCVTCDWQFVMGWPFSVARQQQCWAALCYCYWKAPSEASHTCFLILVEEACCLLHVAVKAEDIHGDPWCYHVYEVMRCYLMIFCTFLDECLPHHVVIIWFCVNHYSTSYCSRADCPLSVFPALNTVPRASPTRGAGT